MSRELVTVLQKLIADPASLSSEDVYHAMDIILSSETVPDEQVAGFLVGSRVAHRDHEPDFLLAVVRRLQESAHTIRLSEIGNSNGLVDIVGTGGDGKNTFNVSTSAAIVVAGMGVAVAKHGGPASTSVSGASDLIVALGAKPSLVTREVATQVMRESPFTYMSGPVFHPILTRTRAVRKKMGVPTVFNLAGPLLNPVPIRARVVGVYAENLGPVFAETIKQLNKTSEFPNGDALVVHGCEGLDELSIAGRTHYWYLDGQSGSVTEGYLHPKDFGLETHSLDKVVSGTPEENAETLLSILRGEKTNQPVLDYILLNAAALAVVAKKAADWADGVRLARESISSGSALKALENFVSSSEKFIKDTQ